jgi:hypothetical protein
MEHAILTTKVIDKAAKKMGNYTELAKRLNRSYRVLLLYRRTLIAPSDIVATIEAIAADGKKA